MTETRHCEFVVIFNDVINNKHVILSAHIREQVNKTVDKFVVLPIIDLFNQFQFDKGV